MGQAIRKLSDTFFDNSNIKVVVLGLGNAGKTTILNKLLQEEVFPTTATVGGNVKVVQFRNVRFTMHDEGGQTLLRTRELWKHYFYDTHGLIYVVDSVDRESIGDAKAVFQEIIRDPFMLNNVILVFANKQEMEGAMTPKEVSEALGLYDIKNHKWHIQSTCALKGEGINEGMTWFSEAIKDLKLSGHKSSINT